ncbi:hypothetical protein BHE74_00053967 [Ensete ventricosum]|nr:hypothetical protein BHE74_00053967 [Ensete ventricosum]
MAEKGGRSRVDGYDLGLKGRCDWELVRSASRVSRVCQDGTREFAKRRPRLAERLSGVDEKLTGRIGKLAGNTLGDYRKKTRRLTARILEDVGLVGGQRVNRSYPGVRAAEPPKSAGKPPVPSFSDYI